MTQGPRTSRYQRGWWQIAAAAAADILSNDAKRKATHEQMDAQREFAQMGIRWKVADAKAAGIHPLYALGAQGASYSPVINAGDNYDRTFDAMGQYLDRAQRANEPQGDRLGAFMQQQEQLQTQRDKANVLWEEQVRGERQRNIGLQLDNEAKRLLLLKTAREMGPPGASATGAAPFGAVKVEPSEQISADKGLHGLEAAPTPGFKTYRYGKRSIDLPNEALSESLEGQGAMGHVLAPIMFGQHYWDKWGVGEWFSRNLGPPPKGYKRVFDPRTRSIVLVPK